MTVKDLIEKLLSMPQDAVVVIDMRSECQELDDDQPKLEERIKHGPSGQWMAHIPHHWPKDQPPVLTKVCHFPGN